MKKEEKNDISVRLRYVLQARRLSQSELSKLTGIPFASISGYMSGKFVPKVSTVCKIAAAVGVSLNWLAGLMPLDAINEPDCFRINDPIELEVLSHFRSLNREGQKIILSVLKGMENSGDYRFKFYGRW